MRKSQGCGGCVGFGLLPVPSKVFSLGKVMLVNSVSCQLHLFLSLALLSLSFVLFLLEGV